jgi:Protein of unknown function (DUF4019)
MTKTQVCRQGFSRFVVQPWAFIALTLICSLAHSMDADDAKQAAKTFNAEFDANRMNQVYDDFAGQFARSLLTKAAFVSNLTVYRSNFGGGATKRTTIQEQFGKTPDGKDLFSIRYQVVFPNATVYEDLTMMKEAPGGWKMYGIFFNPVPTQ